MTSKEEELSALAADYYCLTNSRGRCATNTQEEREPKRTRALDFVERSRFFGEGTTKLKSMVLRQNSVVIAVVHVDTS